MKYISGIYALNMVCSLGTLGDWHSTSLNWEKADYRESTLSLFQDYGIEQGITLKRETVLKANHIRAVLDLLERSQFGLAQDARIWIDENYWPELFSKVELLKNQENWNEICLYMGKEFRTAWTQFRRNEKTQNMISYNGKNKDEKKLKIESSYENKEINKMLLKKCLAYTGKDKIRDMYDVLFIADKYWDSLNETSKEMLFTTILEKGLEYFDYIVETQCDEFINIDDLTDKFLKVCQKVGIIVDNKDDENNDNEIIDNNEKKLSKGIMSS